MNINVIHLLFFFFTLMLYIPEFTLGGIRFELIANLGFVSFLILIMHTL